MTDRKTGETTRRADAAIQTLFTKGEVVVKDHIDYDFQHNRTFDIVLRRLKEEHPWMKVTVERKERRITLNGFNKNKTND